MIHSFSVIGPGRLGQSLIRALDRAGFQVAAVVRRNDGNSTTFEHELNPPLVSLADVAALSEVLFLTVPDEQISLVAERLQVGSKHLVVHCSGACELSVLEPIVARGAQAACFHPLQAFPAGSGHERFVGVHVGIEADGAAFELLSSVARRLQAAPFSLAGVDRASYHAAAVFASNYLVAVQAAATRVWELAGLPAQTAWPALQPLAAGALSAICERSLAEGLTGPVARGDVATVERHLRALSEVPALAALYQQLGAQLLRLGKPDDIHKQRSLQRLFALPVPGAIADQDAGT